MAEKAKPAPQSAATWEDVDAALLRLCEVDSERQHMMGDLNERIALARAAYQEGLDELANEDRRLRATIEQFAREHVAESAKKSVERSHGVLSFRATPPAVKVLRRSWTEEERIESVRSELGADCIRTTEDIARDVILARAQAARSPASSSARPDCASASASSSTSSCGRMRRAASARRSETRRRRARWCEAATTCAQRAGGAEDGDGERGVAERQIGRVLRPEPAKVGLGPGTRQVPRLPKAVQDGGGTGADSGVRLRGARKNE